MNSFEARSKVLEVWLALSEFKGLDAHLQFYIKSGILSSPSDLYKLSLRHLYVNPDIVDEDAYAILESVENCKNVGMSRALLSLVPDADPTDIKELTSLPRSIQDIVEALETSKFHEDLEEELERLVQVGVRLDFREDPIFDQLEATPFTDKRVVVAGKLSATHEVVKDSLESMGAKIDDKVTKDTDFLLIGEGTVEEVELAVKIGTKIITESDVAEMLGVE